MSANDLANHVALRAVQNGDDPFIRGGVSYLHHLAHPDHREQLMDWLAETIPDYRHQVELAEAGAELAEAIADWRAGTYGYAGHDMLREAHDRYKITRAKVAQS